MARRPASKMTSANLEVVGAPSSTTTKSRPTTSRPIGAQVRHQVMQPSTTERQGVPVNPHAVCSNPVPNAYPYKPEDVFWAVLNK